MNMIYTNAPLIIPVSVFFFSFINNNRTHLYINGRRIFIFYFLLLMAHENAKCPNVRTPYTTPSRIHLCACTHIYTERETRASGSLTLRRNV